MTKIDLVKSVSKETKLSVNDVTKVLDTLLNNIISEVSNGKEVTLRGFGTFCLKHRAEKIARDIHKNISVTIPARDVPVFKPSKYFLPVH